MKGGILNRILCKTVTAKNNICSKGMFKHELCYKKAKRLLLNTFTRQRPAKPIN